MKVEHGVAHYDASDPADLAVLIENGLVWSAGQKAQAAAVEALLSGAVPMNDRVPPGLRSYIEAQSQPAEAPQ